MNTANWYYAKGEQKFGPFTDKELVALLGDGKIQRTDMVWKEGMKVWIPISQVVKRGTNQPPPVNAKWFYKKGEREHGPFTSQEMHHMTINGTIAPQDLVWEHGKEPVTSASFWGSASPTKHWMDYVTPKSTGAWILVIVLSPIIIMLLPIVPFVVAYFWWMQNSAGTKALAAHKSAAEESLAAEREAVKISRKTLARKIHKM